MGKENTEHIIDYDIIAKYIAGEANSDEKAFVDRWISKSDENKAIFDQLTTVWHDTGSISQDIFDTDVDMDTAWSNIQSNISIEEAKKPVTSHNKSLKLWWQVAAAVIIVAVGMQVINYIFSDNLNTPFSEIKTLDHQKDIRLPDGSIITLNANSSISYSTEFKGATRKVKLEGEAFFDVAHDKNKPFIVEAQTTAIEVLGTKFSVSTIDDSVSVFLESGQVMFSHGKDELLLVPGNSASFSPKQKSLAISDDSLINPLYWKNSTLNYSSTPLSSVIKELNLIFNKNIVIESKDLSNCPFSATFEDEKLDTILDILSSSFEIQIKQDSSGIYLYGIGC